jgi:putative aldouronate transport system permease protein
VNVSGRSVIGKDYPLSLAGTARHARRWTGFTRQLRRAAPFLVIASPGILFVLIFNYVPLYGILIAFEDFSITKGILESPWVGLKNIEFFVRSGALERIVPNTILLNLLFLVTGTAAALVIALALNEVRSKLLKRVSQSLMFLPYFVSWVVVSMMMQSFLSGEHALVNQWLRGLGLGEVNWYQDSGVWPGLLAVMRIWKGAGYQSVIYLAVLTAVPNELYEAAEIDGASRVQLATHISLPYLVPTVSILTLLAVGSIFRGDFGMIYALVGDNPLLFRTTDVIDTYVFRALRTLGDLGMAAAVSLAQSVAGFVAVLIANWVTGRYLEGGALF